MLARVGEVIADLKANPPPLPPAERDRGDRVHGMAGRPRISRFSASANIASTGKNREPVLVPDSGLGVLRRADAQELRGRAGHEVITAATARLVRRADRAAHHQGEPALARASPRVHGHGQRQALRRGRQRDRRIPHRRPVHLDRLYALDPHHPLSAPQGRRRAEARAASARRAIPARRWSTCSRPIRATSCSRSTTICCIEFAMRSCSSRSGRACACWRGATVSTASCRCWSICRATAPRTM